MAKDTETRRKTSLDTYKEQKMKSPEFAEGYEEMGKELEEVLESKVEVKIEVEPLISFDHWFGLTGKPAHHKIGMQAFASTKGRQTKSKWTQKFESY